MSPSFGAALRECRRAAGLSQRALAARTGLDFSYISKLENGRLPPPAAGTVVALCRALGVAAEELLALVGKLPSDVREAVSGSGAAQAFLRQAQEMRLSEEEWERLAEALRTLRRSRVGGDGRRGRR